MIKFKKLLACLMIVCTVLSLMPLAAFATEGETGTYSVQVDFTTGVTQLEDFRVGISSTPNTGDESNIGLWIGIMACSAIIVGCGAFVLIHKNRKNKK